MRLAFIGPRVLLRDDDWHMARPSNQCSPQIRTEHMGMHDIEADLANQRRQTTQAMHIPLRVASQADQRNPRVSQGSRRAGLDAARHAHPGFEPILRQVGLASPTTNRSAPPDSMS